MIAPATATATDALDECLYCGYSVAEGATLHESGLCSHCYATPPICAKPGEHGWPCDCAAGLCD